MEITDAQQQYVISQSSSLHPLVNSFVGRSNSLESGMNASKENVIGNSLMFVSNYNERVDSQSISVFSAGLGSMKSDTVSSTIADRGTTANIMNLATAQKLIQEGIIEEITPMENNENIVIVFGKKSAREQVLGTIKGAGLLDTIYVVENAESTLISDTSFTGKGVVLIQDDDSLYGVINGEIVLKGIRNKGSSISSNESLWNLDIRELLCAVLPGRNGGVQDQSDNASALQIATSINEHHNRRGSNVDNETGEIQITAAPARPTYTIEDVRKARQLIKGWGNRSPSSLADTIENNAVKNIPTWLTPALLRAVASDKSNVPLLLSTTRKFTRGGTGIRSNKAGECISFDDHGKFIPSTYGACFAAMLTDEATLYSASYPLVSKKSMILAVQKFCQYSEQCGHGPVRMARYDAGSLATKNGQLTKEFAAACAHWKIQLVPSAAEDQQTNPVERSYQLASHIMCTLFLSQTNLSKKHWLLFMYAANVNMNTVCRRGEKKTPCELFTGIVPDVMHLTSFATGSLALCPRVGKKQVLESMNELVVVICPMLTSRNHLVLKEGDSIPVVRCGLQHVQPNVARMSDEEVQQKLPTYDEDGRLIDFFSRKDQDFSLVSIVDSYEKGEDIPEGESSLSLDSMEIQRLTSCVGDTSDDNPYTTPIDLEETSEKLVEGTHTEPSEESEEQWAAGILDSLHTANSCTLELVRDILQNLQLGPHADTKWSDGTAAINAGKARRVHTEASPTPGMLERDKELAAMFEECTRLEVDGGIKDGTTKWITEEQFKEEGYKLYRAVVVYVTKRCGKRKCRLTFSGNDDPVNMFDPDDLFAPSLEEDFHKFITAFATYFGMKSRTTDVSTCFRSHNSWDRSKYPRKICVRLTPYQAGGPESRLIAFETCTYGARDAPGQWYQYSNKVLIESCGMRKLRATHSVYYKLGGIKSLYVALKICDDIEHFHTDDEIGTEMCEMTIQAMKQEGWNLTQVNPTLDFNSIIHKFDIISGKKAVTLTQPTQIMKLVSYFYNDEQVPPTYLAMSPKWSELASIQCEDKIQVTEYLRPMGMLQWMRLTRGNTAVLSLLAGRQGSPSAIDLEAAKVFTAYLATSKHIGITFYEGPDDRDIRKPMPFHVFTDAAQAKHVDLQCQMAYAIKAGERGHPGGAFAWKSIKASGVVGDSMAINEAMALLQVTKKVVCFRHACEELAGLDLQGTEIDDIIDGSSSPTKSYVSNELIEVVAHKECGSLGHPAADMASLQARKKYEPTWIGEDNQGTVNVVNHISADSRGLKRITRVISHLMSLVEQRLIAVQLIKSEEQQADQMTKPCVSPVEEWRKNELTLGSHPDIVEMQQLVHKKFNKRAGAIVPGGINSEIEVGKGNIHFADSFGKQRRRTGASVDDWLPRLIERLEPTVDSDYLEHVRKSLVNSMEIEKSKSSKGKFVGGAGFGFK